MTLEFTTEDKQKFHEFLENYGSYYRSMGISDIEANLSQIMYDAYFDSKTESQTIYTEFMTYKLKRGYQ
jgi:hypothetical protein